MRYLSEVGNGVSFLHKRRYIHRNLRAKSVFVYSNGNVSQSFSCCTLTILKSCLECRHIVSTNCL